MIIFFEVIGHISSENKPSFTETVIVSNKRKNSEMDFFSKLMQVVAQADFINGNTLLLIMVFLFVQDRCCLIKFLIF